MKKIGLLGGMTWKSSIEYYRVMNETVRENLGGCSSANCVMHSFDFQPIEDLQHKNDWDELTRVMVEEAKNLKKAGAECIVICTNTMHHMADTIKEETDLELIHIAEATADEAIKRNVDKVLLLGTRFTMEGEFYQQPLRSKGLEVVLPDEEDRQVVHDIIYNELVRGIFTDASREKYKSIINKMGEQGVQGVILGCTEIPLLISDQDVDMEVFDTTTIHAKAAVDFALD